MVGSGGVAETPKITTSKLYFNALTGVISATEYDSLSDINHKTEIKNVSNSIEKLGKIRGINFIWKENGIKSMGVIAQEVESIFPEIVHTNPKGEKTVAYNGLIAVLIEAIKDQQHQIDQLKTTIKENKWLH
jgi:hypothetical protein